jgi:hypothetical protein
MVNSHIRSLQSLHVQHMDTQNEDADAVWVVPFYVNKGGNGGKKEKSGVLDSYSERPMDPVQVYYRARGGSVTQNSPYRGPTTHEETREAMFHVKSPGNAGGGPDIDIVTV